MVITWRQELIIWRATNPLKLLKRDLKGPQRTSWQAIVQGNPISRLEELKRVLVIVARFSVLAGTEACRPLRKITNLLPETTSTREPRIRRIRHA